MASTLVYFVRHGQTDENLKMIIQGQMDTKLDATGVEQSAAVADALKEVEFSAAFSSDLLRTVDTANAILQHHPGLALEKIEIIRERYMGNLQGRAMAGKKRFTLDESVETSEVFIARVLQFWDEMIIPLVKKLSDSHSDRPFKILVVSHGAFISTLVRALIQGRGIECPAGMPFWCPNCSITVVQVHPNGGGNLEKFGEMSHLLKLEPVVVGNADELKGNVNDLYHKEKASRSVRSSVS